jgi:stage V sporulation protein SpoVS
MSQLAGQPILILKEGSSRTRGRDAQGSNIAAAKAVAGAVRTTLGPKGMDKMLVSSFGDVTISNDGATIVKEMDVQHPAAKMLVEVAKTQDAEVGDGTTTAMILAGSLLKKAEDLRELLLLAVGVGPALGVLEHIVIVNPEQPPLPAELFDELGEVEVVPLEVVLQRVIQIAPVYKNGNSVFHSPPKRVFLIYYNTEPRRKNDSIER